MNVENATPFPVEALPTIGPGDKPGVTIIVKGTFTVGSDRIGRPADNQLPMAYGDEPHDPEKGGSIKFESDLAPFKPRADIALVGRAYAPGGVPAETVRVSLRVGDVSKTLLVIGDRRWKCAGRLLPAVITRPAPFTEMALIYERAFGGVDTVGGGYCPENPVGRGFVVKKTRKALNGVPLPNIEDPRRRIRSWKDRPQPAGLGFYAKSWAPRVNDLGTYDEAWRKNRAPRPPLDFRFDHYNAAHPDLRVRGYLKGDEPVELVNLTPDGYLHFRLPGKSIQCTATKSFEITAAGGAAPADGPAVEPRPLPPEPVEMNLDTLCLRPDEKRFYLVWRGICPVADVTAMEVKKITIRELPSMA